MCLCKTVFFKLQIYEEFQPLVIRRQFHTQKKLISGTCKLNLSKMSSLTMS